MKRRIAEFPIPENFLHALLSFSRKHNPVMILNSNRQHPLPDDRYSTYDMLAAIGVTGAIRGGANCFPVLQQFLDTTNDWVFGALTYDLKNQLEKLTSSNGDHILFPDYHFFCPRYVLSVPKGKQKLFVHYLPGSDDPESVKKLMDEIRFASPQTKESMSRSDFQETTNISLPSEKQSAAVPAPDTYPTISSLILKEEYIENVNLIKKHIRRGDIYEMNYCVEFFSDNTVVDPVSTFLELNNLSPMPFSCFYRLDEHYLLCASPERFLKKSGTKIISQPIKGTARRGRNEAEDKEMKEYLFQDPKERSENVMIVDVVRNDLSRTAKRGTVQVEELFGIYSFQSLHQMISTVVSEVDEGIPVTEVIRHAFPMGSMTGAPKVRAMQLIEEFEQTKRGLYSGSVGYFTPKDEVPGAGAGFDFNVVIRSLNYNEKTKTLSFMAGSAITIDSEPEREYEECLLKARTLMNVLTHD